MKTYSSHIRHKIMSDLESISSPNLLMQILDFLKVISLSQRKPNSNRNAVLALAGSINDTDAAEVSKIIDQEFNQIEGDW